MASVKRPPSAVWLVHKPAGPSSFEVMQALRRTLEGPWPLVVSHGGVLDPFASGLLVVLVGAATRVFDFLHEAPKRYLAQVQWGRETDTGDGGGRTIAETGRVPPSQALAEVTAPLLGWTEQVPPATSNKRVDGERAYVRAHRGEVVVLPPSRVYLHEARWSAIAGAPSDRSQLELVCRGGFYVRSLVRDVGRALGVGAHVVELTRTQLGPWVTPRLGAPVELRGRDVLPWLSSRRLSDAEWGAVRRGALVEPGSVEPAGWPLPVGFPPATAVRLFHREHLVALVVEGSARVVVLPGGL
jgi:tRNA pseudouridine55 synthase